MKPFILITNDDGIFSPGLLAAVEAATHLGDILVAAPRHPQSAMSHAFPGGDRVGIVESVNLEIADGSCQAFGVHGSPAQAVVYALLELASRKPSLCISGINYGENLGRSLTCSGTIGAALEASLQGIPSLAVNVGADVAVSSSSRYIEQDWSAGIYFTSALGHKYTHS